MAEVSILEQVNWDVIVCVSQFLEPRDLVYWARASRTSYGHVQSLLWTNPKLSSLRAVMLFTYGLGRLPQTEPLPTTEDWLRVSRKARTSHLRNLQLTLDATPEFDALVSEYIHKIVELCPKVSISLIVNGLGAKLFREDPALVFPRVFKFTVLYDSARADDQGTSNANANTNANANGHATINANANANANAVANPMHGHPVLTVPLIANLANLTVGPSMSVLKVQTFLDSLHKDYVNVSPPTLDDAILLEVHSRKNQ